MNAITTLKPATRSAGISLLLAAALGSSFGLATAQAEGPAEKAGQQVDQAADKAGQAAADVKESASSAVKSTGEYMGDSAITTKVKWAVMQDPVLKMLEISVATTGGVVLLTGAVDSQQSIDKATAVARGIPAVKSVENRLTVKEAKVQTMDKTVQVTDKTVQVTADTKASEGGMGGMAGMAESTGEYMDDSAITAKVKWAIMRDPVLNVLEISVTTTDGVVLLTGAVDSQQSIDKATAVTRSITAVKSVENRLTVKEAKEAVDHATDKTAQVTADTKASEGGVAAMAESTGEYMDDSAITAKVKWAIMRDPVLNMLEISVATTDGVVSLSGAIDSQQSIDKATEVTRSITAVKSVENHLTIKDAK